VPASSSSRPSPSSDRLHLHDGTAQRHCAQRHRGSTSGGTTRTCTGAGMTLSRSTTTAPLWVGSW
jgi:hypothetical protein